MAVQKLVLKRLYRDEDFEKLKGNYIDESYIKLPLITEDTDAYDTSGNLLLKFRKKVLDVTLLKTAVDSFEGSIVPTESRGMASGGSFKRVRKDGTVSKITVSNKVTTGAVGMMDPVAMVPYCRKTAYTAAYYDVYKEGIPFLQRVDELYAELVPNQYAVQKQYAEATNPNWVIPGTCFTTVTVNKNFRTAIHKDSGDLRQGFGNLIAYREGDWTGNYFMLPEYGIGVDLHNGDMLFVDVHKWHCNTPFLNFDEATCKRISFVVYYREYMLKCDSPSKELERIKIEKNGFFRL